MLSVHSGFSVGLGYSGLCDILCLLNLKFMDKSKYLKVEQKVFTIIKSTAVELMKQALKDEVAMANVLKGDQGIHSLKLLQWVMFNGQRGATILTITQSILWKFNTFKYKKSYLFRI